MYKKILVPVDLEHIGKLDKALSTAADLAKHYNTSVCYAGVTTTTPTSVARTPAEFAEKLEAFVSAEAKARGINIDAHVTQSHDPAADLGDTLLGAIEAVGADLVVMASHLPGLPEHIFTSNAGFVASHATVSVFVVR